MDADLTKIYAQFSKFTNYLYELQISEKYMSSCSQILEKVINCLSKRGENNHPSPKAIPVLPDASSITAVTMEGSASDDGSASATGFNLHQRQAQDLPWLGGRLLVWEGDFPVYLHCARGDAELCGELCWGRRWREWGAVLGASAGGRRRREQPDKRARAYATTRDTCQIRRPQIRLPDGAKTTG